MQDKTRQSAFFERNNFYFGKLMTARDFTDEQRYFNEKRWMVNHFGLGWGVLCGLKVRPHDCERNRVIVEPGFAIDRYGHEIAVFREETVDLTTAQDDCPPETPYLYYVSIKYEECAVNPSPVPIEDCDDLRQECVFNRTREAYRFVVTRRKPEFTSVPECETSCHRVLLDPSPVISQQCPERPECEPVPLARVCYNPQTKTTAMDIDIGPANRKLALSNELLQELLRCLQQEVWQNRAAHHDRRQHVPLLASTIKGLTFQDGKNAKLDRDKHYEGKYPFRLTSDGDYIWVTDREDNQIWRIDRMTNTPIEDPRLRLESPSWGIAYDGSRHMWISHHEAFREAYRDESEADRIRDEYEAGRRRAYGKLTRVDVCTLQHWTISGLLGCGTLPGCHTFPESACAPDAEKFLPYPGEVVLHDGDIYVAHDLPRRHRDPKQEYGDRKPPAGEADAVYDLSLTRIDPVRGCIVEVIDVPAVGGDPWSRIRAMASDGDALWITYRASSRDSRRGRAVARKITKEHGKSVVSEPFDLDGDVPERMAFEGTRLWVSHNDGLSIIDVETGKEEKTINPARARITGVTYVGGEFLMVASPGGSEASVSWINIYTEELVPRMELIELPDSDSRADAAFEISDMQFDGAYVYVAYHLKEGQVRKGLIHRLLP